MTHPTGADLTATKRAAHATQTEVTDEQIIAAYLAWCKTNGTPESFARAILALRPERVPMTDEQRQSAFLSAPTSSGGHRTAFMLGIQFAEAHHDNTACKSVQKRLEAQQSATTEPVAGEWFCGNCRVPVPSPASHPAPSVPDDVVRVPLQILKDASEALGNFVSDHGWGDADMQAMDNLDAYITRYESNRAAKDVK